MRLLALDAAGLTCSAALSEGGVSVAVRTGGDSRRATAALPGLVADMLAEFGPAFDAVAVTVGPGSFTGLRGALALAHGLALGAGVPVVGVTVAEALLHRLARAGPVWVALDARRTGRIFLDTGDGMAACSLDVLPAAAGSVTVVGDAAAAVCARYAWATLGAVQAVPMAAVAAVGLLRLTGAIGACPAQPLYLQAAAA